MHDQPLKPIDLAVYWIEFVIRNKGAPHLRSTGIDLKWYQREMIDIIVFLVISVIAILGTVYLISRTIVRKLVVKKKPVQKSKKKIN